MVKMRIKGLFFDSPKVMRAVDAATRRALSKAGAFIMTRARQSIKKAPYITKKKRGQARTDFRQKTSISGKPPYSRTGILKRTIFFGYEPAGKTVVIGPVKYGKGEAPNLLEFGGSVTRTVPPPAFMKGKGKSRRVRMKYKPRPFMGPAMVKELPNLPKRWAGSMRST